MKKHKTNKLLLAVCPECGKRVLHPRGELDPKKAVWCFLKCDDCADSGDKDYQITFFGEHGWMEYDPHKNIWYSPLIETYHLHNAMNGKKMMKVKPIIKDLVWIAALDTDSFNYSTKQETRSDAESHYLKHFQTEQEAQKHCDHLNSL